MGVQSAVAAVRQAVAAVLPAFVAGPPVFVAEQAIAKGPALSVVLLMLPAGPPVVLRAPRRVPSTWHSAAGARRAPQDKCDQVPQSAGHRCLPYRWASISDLRFTLPR